MAEMGNETLDGLLERARELMKSGKLTPEQKETILNCTRVMDEEGITTERRTGRGVDILIMRGWRNDKEKGMAAMIPSGEETPKMYNEEQMKAIIGLSSILAENGKIVKTEKK